MGVIATVAATLAALLYMGRSGAPNAGAEVVVAAPARPVTWTGRTMGTFVNVTLVTADSVDDDPLARRALGVFRRVDSLMSNWTTTSEVARLNREAAAGPTKVEHETARVLEASLDLWRDSDGAFDITVEPLVRAWGFLGGKPHVPTDAEAQAAKARVGGHQLRYDRAARTLAFANDGVRIDLGGIAKGYAVDVAAESLAAHGVKDALLNLSGNMVAMGAPPGAPRWRIGIRDPRDRVPYFARIELSGEAISTSGKYEQFVAANGKTYGHIIDPHTGRPAEGLISVTVVGKTALDCDAWDTPLFVLGRDAAMRKARERGAIGVVLVEPGADGIDTVWVEKSLADRFHLETAAREWFRMRVFE